MVYRDGANAMIMNQYFHLLPGRLRMDVQGLLGNQSLAKKLAGRLSSLPGVRTGRVNPVSGQVLVLFNPKQVSLQAILGQIVGLPPGRALRRKLFKKIDYPIKQKAARPPVQKQPSMMQVKKTALVSGRRGVVQPVKNPSLFIPWHTLETDRLLSMLGTVPGSGLQIDMVRKRLHKFGYNEIAVRSSTSILCLLLEPLKGFMSKLLLAAAGISLLVGESSDALVISIIVLLQAVLEAVQGYRAEKSLAALKELSAPVARVVRSGRPTRVQARELVPGDLIVLEAGDRIPADARLLEVSGLMVDESSLTGESVPVAKSCAACSELKLTIGDRNNMVFAGTCVTSGRGMAAIVATGMGTEMGKIAALLADVENETTPLQKQMETLGQQITRLVMASVAGITIIGLVRGRPLLEMLRTGVSLAVGAIPEGLPAVVTVALAFGVQRMVRRNAVVRRLSAVEALGGTTVVCTDKTGTLTQNEMTVKEVFCNDELYRVTGEGYRPQGHFLHQGQTLNPAELPALQVALRVGALCNNAALNRQGENKWKVIGDPTEGALLTAAAKAGLWWKNLNEEYCRERELAFDSNRRMMTVICRAPDNNFHVYSKGAPDTVLGRCSRIVKNGAVEQLDIKTRNDILAMNDKMAGRALRVLALAWKDMLALEPNPTEAAVEEADLIFTGLAGMADPPRQGVGKAVRKCQEAGVRVVMITGDHKKTAEAVAQKIGILQQGGLVVTGDELDNLSAAKLAAAAEKIQVYSRTSPAQKLRIVRALKKRGHIVAMTGDGVNDAPAVKEANIGLAMGLSGTDVTREASGITLSDDNFTTIVAGIEEGRSVSENILKSIRYVLSGNMGQVLAVLMASIGGLPTPLLAPQILWINLVTECLPAMALAADPPQANCMRRPPVRSDKMIFSDSAKKEIIRKGIMAGITTFGVYAGGMDVGWSQAKARTMAFSHLVMSRVFNIFDSRRVSRDLSGPGTGNRYVLPAAGVSTAMLLLTMYVPVLRPLFSTVPLALADWGLLGITAGIVGRVDSVMRGLKVAKQ